MAEHTEKEILIKSRKARKKEKPRIKVVFFGVEQSEFHHNNVSIVIYTIHDLYTPEYECKNELAQFFMVFFLLFFFFFLFPDSN